MKQAVDIEIEDEFFASAYDVEEFIQSRIWREMVSWLKARRERLADDLDSAATELELKLIQRERSALRDMMDLPTLILSTLQQRGANEEKDDNDESERTTE